VLDRPHPPAHPRRWPQSSPPRPRHPHRGQRSARIARRGRRRVRRELPPD